MPETAATGTFCWSELGTTDGEGAKKFYSGLFGWQSIDNPMGPGMVYTRAQVDGKDVAAMYKMGPDQQGVPPHWLNYISVNNADTIVASAKANGATVIMAPMDVMDFGRMAVLQDPTGAAFAIWQPGTHVGFQHCNAINGTCWFELATKDDNRAREFYCTVFGWNAKTMPMDGMNYTILNNGARDVGGLMQMTPEFGNAPSHWMVYFAVADCDASAAKAQALGGNVCLPPTDIPNVGRFAVLNDPQGATFAIIRLSAMA